MTTAIISHSDCRNHDNGSSWHPESAGRLDAITDQLIRSGVDAVLQQYESRPVSKQQLELAHDPEYVKRIFALAPASGERTMLDGDTGMNEHSLDAALLAAGAAVMAVDLVMGGDHQSVFCAIRPPGHHAGKAHSAGFCIFNNIAIAARYAQSAYGLKRVAIVDFDVHHGDGTQQIVENDPSILFCSSFQHPFYPYSGANAAAGNVLNIPMPAGTRGTDWRPRVEDRWFAALDAFRPELILISAGFDSHREDDMGGFNLVEDDYVWITRKLCALAAEHANNRIVSCLEGGYDFSSLGRSVAAHVKAMADVYPGGV